MPTHVTMLCQGSGLGDRDRDNKSSQGNISLLHLCDDFSRIFGFIMRDSIADMFPFRPGAHKDM